MPKSLNAAVYLVPEVAQLLSTTDWTIYEMIKRDEIPGVIRVGNKIRIVKRVFHEGMGLEPTAPSTDEERK